MFSIFSTVILYNAVFILAFALCSIGEKTHEKSYTIWAYIIISVLSAIRYDIGADYDGYTLVIETIANDFRQYGFNIISVYKGIRGFEPGIIVFSSLFSYASNPQVWVVALYSVLTMALLYRAMEKYNAHKWGLLMFFLSGLLFTIWDVMRQGLALAILLNSLPCIKEKKILNFFLLVGLASMVHYSAFLFSGAYFIGLIKIKKRVSIAICLSLFVLAEFGILTSLNGFLVSITPFYSDIYTAEGLNTTMTYHDLSYIFNAFFLISLIYMLPESDGALSNVIMVGTAIHIIAGGLLNIDRIGYYYSSFQLFAVPLIIKQNQTLFKRVLLYSCLSALFVLCNIHIWSQTYKGCSPYETVFSEEFQRKQFRDDY